MNNVEILDYDSETLGHTMDKMVKQFVKDRLDKGRRIVIKTDLSAGLKSYESGAIVPPDLVDSLIASLNNNIQPSEILIVESENKDDLDVVFKETGYFELAEKYDNVKLVNLNKSDFIKVLNPEAKILKQVTLPEQLVLNDFFISISTLKRHLTERIAGCWMNQYNCIPNKSLRIKLQPFFPEVTFDLNSLLWPAFNILSANYALEGAGPVEGNPKYVGKIIFGENALVTDIVATEMTGEKLSKIPHLNYAYKKLKRSKLVDINSPPLHYRADNTPKKDTLAYINNFEFNLFKISFKIKRFAQLLENLGLLLFIGSFALVSVGGRTLLKGRWMPIRDYFTISRSILTKIEEPENLLNWKIVINKHVIEESIS